MSDQRADTLNEVARHLGTLLSGHPLRVGIDGVCGAGKSAFARDLAVALEAIGRSVIHIDSDGFHHIRERRYRQGRDSARGYYDDAYDFDSLTERVLLPLGPAGSREYAVRVHDLTTDAVIDTETAQAPSGAVVIFDATFIQRDTLRELWDEVIYLHSTVEAAMARASPGMLPHSAATILRERPMSLDTWPPALSTSTSRSRGSGPRSSLTTPIPGRLRWSESDDLSSRTAAHCHRQSAVRRRSTHWLHQMRRVNCSSIDCGRPAGLAVLTVPSPRLIPSPAPVIWNSVIRQSICRNSTTIRFRRPSRRRTFPAFARRAT